MARGQIENRNYLSPTGFKFSLDMPISFIIGRPTNIEDDPVIAKTMNMRIISQR